METRANNLLMATTTTTTACWISRVGLASTETASTTAVPKTYTAAPQSSRLPCTIKTTNRMEMRNKLRAKLQRNACPDGIG
eukprot:909416-Lingulodinium_polyedra.AAC.1